MGVDISHFDKPDLNEAYTPVPAPGAFGGQPVVATRPYGPGRGFQTAYAANGNARIAHKFLTSVSEIRLVYTNWNGAVTGEAAGSNTVVVTAGVEYPSSTFLPQPTFQGSQAGNVGIDGILISDPIAIDGKAGDTFFTRTHSTGTTIRGTGFTPGTGGEGTATSVTDSSQGGAISGAGNYYGPSAIIGVPTSGITRVPWVALIGDSIPAGVGDFANASFADQSYIKRALQSANIPYVDLCRASEQLSQGMGVLTGSSRRRRLGAGASYVFCGSYADNDIAAGASLATVQASAIAAWTAWTNRGAKVITQTLLPRTTSTDNFQTLQNQTPVTGEAVRVAYNTWIRTGAPIVNGTAVTQGTSGAIVAGQSGHPLSSLAGASGGYIELADLCESSRNSGLWKVIGFSDSGTTNTSTSITSVGTTTWQNGWGILASAGLAGSLNANVASGGGTATLTIDQTATATGATTIFATYTTDGTHPCSLLHQTMAGAIAAASIFT